MPRGWIRVGGILFALIGLQYLGTGLGDVRQPQHSQTLNQGAPAAEVVAGAAGPPPRALLSAASTAVGSQEGSSSDDGARRHVGGHGSLSFYKATVWSRLMLAAGMGGSKACQFHPPGLR